MFKYLIVTVFCFIYANLTMILYKRNNFKLTQLMLVIRIPLRMRYLKKNSDTWHMSHVRLSNVVQLKQSSASVAG